MSHVLDILLQNKGLICSLLALLVSEILPLVKSTQWNGIMHGVLTALQKEAKDAPK